MHFYPFNIKDWALHTSHLTLEEEGAYRRLLDMYYDTERPIPTETQPVIRRLRLGSYIHEVEQVLSEFFDLEEDGYHNNRADIEIHDYQNRVSSARKNGKKGGRPRKDKGVKTQPVNSANPAITEPITNQELEPVTITSNQVKEVKSPKAQKVKFDPLMVSHEKLNQAAWVEWVEYRKSKGKKISEAAAKKQVKFLTDYNFDLQQASVDSSIANDYQGLFEPKNITTTGVNHGQPGHQQPKPSLVDRVKQQAEQRLRDQEASATGHREFSVDVMAQTHRDVRVQVCEPVRGDAGGDLDNVLDGDYWEANG